MPSRKIEDCVKELQSAWEIIRAEFSSRFPGWTMQLTCTHRTPEEQFDLFKKGRVLSGDDWVVKNSKEVVTNCDGFKKLSNHNNYPSRAFDVALQNPEGEYVWNTGLPQWQSLPDIAEVAEVVNGGSWKTFKDFPHFELRGDAV